MIRLVMTCSLIGTVALIGICTFLSDPSKVAITQNTMDMTPYFAETQHETEELFMQSETIRDMMREEIVGKSIQILRSHGKSDEEIKEMMLKDFSISETALDEILNTQNK